jgi:Uma2 family endonuclease
MIRPNDLATDLVTVDEFFSIVQDGQKADLIEGVIYMASPDSHRASTMTKIVTYMLDGFVAARRIGGDVNGSRFAYILSPLRSPEPDVAYVVPERLHLLQERAMRGGPDIAVEIVSRDSRNRDYNEKRELYRDAGTREYWIIDPIRQVATFLVLQNGEYEETALIDGHIFRSSVVPGFWLDTEWLFADPLPTGYECLERILAQSPADRKEES